MLFGFLLSLALLSVVLLFSTAGLGFSGSATFALTGSGALTGLLELASVISILGGVTSIPNKLINSVLFYLFKFTLISSSCYSSGSSFHSLAFLIGLHERTLHRITILVVLGEYKIGLDLVLLTSHFYFSILDSLVLLFGQIF